MESKFCLVLTRQRKEMCHRVKLAIIRARVQEGPNMEVRRSRAFSIRLKESERVMIRPM